MSLLMQFKFQPVTKYVRAYGMALYYYIDIPGRVTGSFTLRAKCTPKYMCLIYKRCVSSALLVTSVVTLHGRFIRHQSPVHSRARSKYFYACAVCVQLYTRVFFKFKSSCTVLSTIVYFNLHYVIAIYYLHVSQENKIQIIAAS